MHVSVSAGQRRPCGEIGSVQRSILLGQICPNGRERVIKHDRALYNPFLTVAISKPLEMIRRSAYSPRVVDPDRSPFGHKPDCLLG